MLLELDPIDLISGVNQLTISQDSPLHNQRHVIQGTDLGLHHVIQLFVNTQSQRKLKIQACLPIQVFNEYPHIQITERVSQALRIAPE